VTALKVGIETGTGLELEDLVLFVHGPDAGKGGPQIIHHRLRAPPQHLGEVPALDQMRADPRAEGLQAGLFREVCVRSLALGEIHWFPISMAGGSALQFQ